MKKERIVLTVEPWLKARLVTAAEFHGVSISAYTTMALSTHLRTMDKMEKATNAEALGELMLAMANTLKKETAVN